jgi:anti-sigma factor RsiW
MVSGDLHHEVLRLSEDDVSPAERQRLQAHIAGCPVCRRAADEVLPMVDALQAAPSALQPLTAGLSRSWPAVWARVRNVPARRLSAQLRLSMSLAAAAFVLAANLPAAEPAGALHATAGLVQTPLTRIETPVAWQQQARVSLPAGANGDGTSSATTARPVPVPTPMPGAGG